MPGPKPASTRRRSWSSATATPSSIGARTAWRCGRSPTSRASSSRSSPAAGARRRSAACRLLERVGIWEDQLPGRVFLRPHHHVVLRILALVEAAARQVLPLAEDVTRLRPLAVGVEADVADHGREAVRVHVLRELVVVEALGAFDGFRQHLAGGVAERHEAVAERIDAALLPRDCLVALQKVARARKIERRDEILVKQDA